MSNVTTKNLSGSVVFTSSHTGSARYTVPRPSAHRIDQKVWKQGEKKERTVPEMEQLDGGEPQPAHFHLCIERLGQCISMDDIGRMGRAGQLGLSETQMFCDVLSLVTPPADLSLATPPADSNSNEYNLLAYTSTPTTSYPSSPGICPQLAVQRACQH